MTSPPAGPFADLSLNHVEWYVTDAATRAAEFIDRYGFEWYATQGDRPIHRRIPDDRDGSADAYRVALRQGDIVMVLTEAVSDEHPAATYVALHGDGVADIAFRTGATTEAFDAAVACGATPINQPAEVSRGWHMASVQGFGDVSHTFVQPPAGTRRNDPLPGFTPPAQPRAGDNQGLLALDHFAVSLPSGALARTARFYESVFDFQVTFEERIEVGAQAMDSIVVQSLSRDVTLVLIEPDDTTQPGQIDDFLKGHGGPGVQHLAFAAADIVAAVGGLQERGVEFLQLPDSYYELLGSRLTPQVHDVEDLRRLNILVDEDQDGQLFQIFTRSTHPRRTLFLEIIQRVGATTFGSGNIKALYKAVESTRVKAENL
jgi:4-hydroxymandelate synthase